MYDKIGSDPHRKLTVSLATSGMELTDTLELDPSTKSQYLHLPSLPTKVFVYATGAGCSTIQVRTRFRFSKYTIARFTRDKRRRKINSILTLNAFVRVKCFSRNLNMTNKKFKKTALL